MKNKLSAAILLGILASWPLAALRADEGMDQTTESKEHHWDSAKMDKKLGLSDDQATKLKSLRDSEKDAMKPLWDKQKDLMKNLGEQVKAKASDTDIQATLDALKSNRKAIADQAEQFRIQKDAILTSTQQAKMLLMRMKHAHMMVGHTTQQGQ